MPQKKPRPARKTASRYARKGLPPLYSELFQQWRRAAKVGTSFSDPKLADVLFEKHRGHIFALQRRKELSHG